MLQLSLFDAVSAEIRTCYDQSQVTLLHQWAPCMENAKWQQFWRVCPKLVNDVIVPNNTWKRITTQLKWVCNRDAFGIRTTHSDTTISANLRQILHDLVNCLHIKLIKPYCLQMAWYGAASASTALIANSFLTGQHGRHFGRRHFQLHFL